MKQENQTKGTAECNRLNKEEEMLNIDELMNVQGGQENPEDPDKNCSIGCYLAGMTHTTHDDQPEDESEEP